MNKRNRMIRKAISLCIVMGMLVTGVCSQTANARKKVSISNKKLTLKVGQKKKLKVKNTKKKVVWSSKNKKVATVDKKGLVKAKKKGSTTIIAKVGKKKYTCKVTVKKKSAAVKPTKKPTTSASQKPSGPSSNSTPAPSIVPTPDPPSITPTPDAHWDEGKKSGTEEDYNKYFNVDMKEYQSKKESTKMGTIQTFQYESGVVGSTREASIYLPPDYSTSKKYPVLYMIHGLGCDRTQWVYMQLNEILSNMIARNEIRPLIAVVPSVIPKDGLNPNTFSAENIEAFTMFEKEFLEDLEPYILKNYSVSSDRKDTGVCGLSMGGMEALHLGFSIKDHFNYIGSFSAAPTLNQDLLTLEGWKTSPDLVMLCTGTKDGTVGDNPYNYHMSLEKNNVDHIWYLYPNGTHESRVWKHGLVNFLRWSY